MEGKGVLMIAAIDGGHCVAWQMANDPKIKMVK